MKNSQSRQTFSRTSSPRGEERYRVAVVTSSYLVTGDYLDGRWMYRMHPGGKFYLIRYSLRMLPNLLQTSNRIRTYTSSKATSQTPAHPSDKNLVLRPHFNKLAEFGSSQFRQSMPARSTGTDGMQNPTYFFGGELVRPPPEGFPVLEGQPPERSPPLEPPPPLELLLIINFLTKCEKNPPPSPSTTFL